MNEVEKEYLYEFKSRLSKLRDIELGAAPKGAWWESKYDPSMYKDIWSIYDLELWVRSGAPHLPTVQEFNTYIRMLEGVMDAGVRSQLLLLPLDLWAQFKLASRKARVFSMMEMLGYKVPENFGDRLIYPRIADSDWLLIRRMSEYGDRFMQCRDMAGQFIDLYESDYLEDPEEFAKWFLNKYKEMQ